MRCNDEQCVGTIEYTDDEYTILAVFRGAIIGKIARLTVQPRRNCFVGIDDGRFVCMPHGDLPTEKQSTAGTLVFREYDYALHFLKTKERSADEQPVKFDTIIAKDDRIIVITGTTPYITDMQRVFTGKEYEFHGNEEYHACNHCGREHFE